MQEAHLGRLLGHNEELPVLEERAQPVLSQARASVQRHAALRAQRVSRRHILSEAVLSEQVYHELAAS